MDATAILEYFAPLKTWLEEQNKGQTCGYLAASPTRQAVPAPHR